MTSLLALLSQRQTRLQTRKGLILIDLQHDFLSPDGNLPMRSGNDHVDRIREIAPAFRKSGIVIWVRSQYEVDRDVSESIQGTGDSVLVRTAGDSERVDGSSGGKEEKESSMLERPESLCLCRRICHSPSA